MQARVPRRNAAPVQPDRRDTGLRDLLRRLSPSAREHLRHVLIRDQADRAAIASQLVLTAASLSSRWWELEARR